MSSHGLADCPGCGYTCKPRNIAGVGLVWPEHPNTSFDGACYLSGAPIGGLGETVGGASLMDTSVGRELAGDMRTCRPDKPHS